MRPKLKSDTFFIPMGESIYLRNNEKSLAIKGKTLASWLERLAPALDGQHDLADICQTLPQEKRPVLTQFLLTLVEQGYLKDTTPDLPHTLSEELQTTYGPAITFIDSHLDSGASRFQRFLTTPVLAIASGECLLALAHALLETGNRAISLLDTGEEATSYERLQELLTVLQERDRDLQLTLLPGARWHDEAALRSLCASAHTVLYFSTAPVLEPVDRLAGYCRAAGVPFLPACAFQDEIHIGPFQLPDRVGCWQCYWRRAQAARGRPACCTALNTPVNVPAPEATLFPGKPAIGIVANMLAFEFFKYGTNVRKNTLEGMVRVLELQRLQIVKHQLFPHPLCTLCSPQASDYTDGQAVRESIARLRETQAREAHPSELHLEEWIDQNSGIFTRSDDLDYYQLPLIRSQLEVPLSSETAYSLPVIKAAGLDYAEVRMRLLRQATGRYLTSLADPRWTRRGTYQQVRDEAVCPTALAGWLQPAPQAAAHLLAWVWGAQLTPAFACAPLLLPGAAVYPESQFNRTDDGRRLFAPEAGVTSVAASWSQALAEGLAELCLTLVPAPETLWSGARAIEREVYASDPRSAAYQAMLDILGARVTLFECAALTDIPCVAFSVNERYTGLCVHWNIHCALRQALERAVLAVQIERTPGPGEQSGWSQEHAQDVGAILKGIPVTDRLRPSLAEENDYLQGWQKLATCLQDQEWQVAIVPLSEDETLSRLLPCALRLLAIRQGNEGRS